MAYQLETSYQPEIPYQLMTYQRSGRSSRRSGVVIPRAAMLSGAAAGAGIGVAAYDEGLVSRDNVSVVGSSDSGEDFDGGDVGGGDDSGEDYDGGDYDGGKEDGYGDDYCGGRLLRR
ncbi:hypothetical protein B0J14DRAFT_659551 [Halenospora varia]|nr:hypothetical protein B0J14DRAFT_659551 [Halenospora varia]